MYVINVRGVAASMLVVQLSPRRLSASLNQRRDPVPNSFHIEFKRCRQRCDSGGDVFQSRCDLGLEPASSCAECGRRLPADLDLL